MNLKQLDLREVYRRLAWTAVLANNQVPEKRATTVGEYARAYGVHRNTARRHLDAFTEAGVLVCRDVRYRSNARQKLYWWTVDTRKRVEFALGPLDELFPF